MKPFPAYLFLCVWAPLGLVQAFPAEAEWKVGIAETKITPSKPIRLAGYASRTKPFEKIETELYAKALALTDRAGKQALIVTTDLIGLSATVAEAVCARIKAQTGLERHQILLNSAHIHTGPTLSLNPKPGENVSFEDAANTVDYTKGLQDKLVQVGVDALSQRRPGHLSWGSGIAHFAVNRREFTPGGVILGVNPRGLVDRSVPVLRVDDPDGKPLAVLFGYACHNTTLTQTNYEVCADYAGFAQDYVQQQHPSARAMFMIGCAGDANPYPRGTMDLAREHGLELGKEVCRVLTTKLRPVTGSLTTVFDYVSLPLQTSSREELERIIKTGQSWQTENAKQRLALLDRGEIPATEYQCPVAVWQFGTNLTLVALSGEVVVDYVPLLERAIGPLQLWIAAYCNDVFGYLPSARVLEEGGYETRGLYVTNGWFAPRAQGVLIEKVRELAQRAGRKAEESSK